MTTWIDANCILIVLFALSVLGTFRILGIIQIFVAQSLVLGFVPFFLHGGQVTLHDVILSSGTIIFKAVLVPSVLLWAIRRVSMRSEIRPIVGVAASIIYGALLIAGAFWIASTLKLPGKPVSDLVVPCSLATVLLGFMILVTRTQAVTQVLGYLIVENGIFLFALSLANVMPVPLEIGILLDIFVAVFIMAIVVNHINEEFERAPASLSRSKMGETF